MNKEKVMSDIVALEDFILSKKRDIACIQNEINKAELTTTGEDDYFSWRKKLVSAIHAKASLKESAKRQLSYWKDKLSEIKKKEGFDIILATKEYQLKTEKLKLEKANKNAEIQAEIIRLKIKKEYEKTNRYNKNQERNIRIAETFKKVVKEYLGSDEYIMLIKKADELTD